MAAHAMLTRSGAQPRDGKLKETSPRSCYKQTLAMQVEWVIVNVSYLA